MSDEYTKHNMPREVTRRLLDYEVLLSFVDDYGAELFRSWWASEGEKAFAAWTRCPRCQGARGNTDCCEIGCTFGCTLP